MVSIDKIILVEDHTSWRDLFEVIVKDFGEQYEIIKVDLAGFQSRFRSPKDFDEIECAFVDLELGPGSHSELSDMWGLDIVLPQIKQLAPWLPVALISRYISGQTELLCTLSISDFDGTYPKQIISDGTRTHPEFNLKKWKRILSDIKVRRNASLIGRSVGNMNEILKNSVNLKLTPSDDAVEAINKTGEQIFKEGVALLDLGGSEYSLDQILTGFSGSYVAKIGVFGNDSNGSHHTYWLLKWGRPIRKIAEESEAHRRIQRIGIDRSLVVPQLHHNIINWGGYGFIAYGFEKDATTAYEKIKDDGISSINDIVEEICTNLYASTNFGPVSPSETIKSWWNLNENEMTVVSKNNLKNTMSVTKCIIHGDLHLRNILIHKNKPTLIDFASSGFAPLVIDFSKLLIDIIVFFWPDNDEIASFEWDSLEKSALSPFMQIFSKYLKAKDDKQLFKISMECFACNYLTYPDVSDAAKDKIKDILGTV